MDSESMIVGITVVLVLVTAMTTPIWLGLTPHCGDGLGPAREGDQPERLAA